MVVGCTSAIATRETIGAPKGTRLGENGGQNMLVGLCDGVIALSLLVSRVLFADHIHATLSSDDLRRWVRNRRRRSAFLPDNTRRVSSRKCGLSFEKKQNTKPFSYTQTLHDPAASFQRARPLRR